MEENKKIKIEGTYNRYMIKKTTYKSDKNKKRNQSLNWAFDEKFYKSQEQFNLLNTITYENDKAVWNIMKQQINQKINSYKQQDIGKKIFDSTMFLTYEDVLISLRTSELKCYYCSDEIFILYDTSREGKQWSIDRIDNNKGHNKNNYYISCLDCNLKRRCQNDEKFLFTKQLSIKKV